MFKGLSADQFTRKFLGINSDDIVKAVSDHQKKRTSIDIAVDEQWTSTLPESFDSRQQWPSCIGAVRNQLHCGSCWAFSGTSAFADRICINTGQSVVLSPQQLVSCDTFDAHGCHGAMITSSWQYFHANGVVENNC